MKNGEKKGSPSKTGRRPKGAYQTGGKKIRDPLEISLHKGDALHIDVAGEKKPRLLRKKGIP